MTTTHFIIIATGIGFSVLFASSCAPSQRFTIDNQSTSSVVVRAAPGHPGKFKPSRNEWCQHVVKPTTRQTLEYNQKNPPLNQAYGRAVFSMQIGSSRTNAPRHWLLDSKDDCEIVIQVDHSVVITDAQGRTVPMAPMHTSPWEEWSLPGLP